MRDGQFRSETNVWYLQPPDRMMADDQQIKYIVLKVTCRSFEYTLHKPHLWAAVRHKFNVAKASHVLPKNRLKIYLDHLFTAAMTHSRRFTRRQIRAIETH